MVDPGFPEQEGAVKGGSSVSASGARPRLKNFKGVFL